MTLDTMIQNLVRLKQFISDEEITVSDYLKLFDVLSDIDKIKETIEELTLVLEIDDSQETAQKAFDFMVERPRADRRNHSDSSLHWELLPYDFSNLVNSLRRHVTGKAD